MTASLTECYGQGRCNMAKIVPCTFEARLLQDDGTNQYEVLSPQPRASEQAALSEAKRIIRARCQSPVDCERLFQRIVIQQLPDPNEFNAETVADKIFTPTDPEWWFDDDSGFTEAGIAATIKRCMARAVGRDRKTLDNMSMIVQCMEIDKKTRVVVAAAMRYYARGYSLPAACSKVNYTPPS